MRTRRTSLVLALTLCAGLSLAQEPLELSGTVVLGPGCEADPLALEVLGCCAAVVEEDGFELTLSREASRVGIILVSLRELPAECEIAYPPAGLFPVLKNLRLKVVVAKRPGGDHPESRDDGVEQQVLSEIQGLSTEVLTLFHSLEGMLQGSLERQNSISAELLRQEFETRQARAEVRQRLAELTRRYIFGLREIREVFTRYWEAALADHDAYRPRLDDAIRLYNDGFVPLDTEGQALADRLRQNWNELSARKLGELHRQVRDGHDDLLLKELQWVKNQLFEASNTRRTRARRGEIQAEVRQRTPALLGRIRDFERSMDAAWRQLLLELEEPATSSVADLTR